MTCKHPPLESLTAAVMAGLVPAIHVFFVGAEKTWMPGTRPGMTRTEEHYAQK